jgi:tRNA 2-selenouridine synthase
VAVERIHIEQFLELAKHHQIIDVRSPSEYNHAHLPEAYNLPLFSDEERKIVGTTYKQQSREQAIKVGLEFFGPKMRRMVEEVEVLIGNKSRQSAGAISKNATLPIADCLLPIANCLLVYCWRGGMRSAGVAWLLDLYGFKVYTLVGGYKKFRNYVLDTFRQPFELNIIGGFTGSGKTEVLKELKKAGQAVIDLEHIARHKGSAFGNIGLAPQPTQEMFENLLALELVKVNIPPQEKKLQIETISHSLLTTHPPSQSFSRHSHSPIWLEDESQRIGQVNIPLDLWNKMRKSPVYFIDIPFEERLNYLIQEYGNLDKERMIEAIERIRQRLGGLETKNAIQYLMENNISGCFHILLKYYDKCYVKGLHNREGIETLLSKISCEEVNPLNSQRLLRKPAYENH